MINVQKTHHEFTFVLTKKSSLTEQYPRQLKPFQFNKIRTPTILLSILIIPTAKNISPIQMLHINIFPIIRSPTTKYDFNFKTYEFR